MTTTERSSGAQELSVTLGLAALAWLVMAVQEVLLFVRPAPYGGPYVTHITLYFPYALFYNLLGVMVVAAPVAIAWLAQYHRPVRPQLARLIHTVELWLLILVVALDHADNEVYRFMGIHLTRSLMLTYLRVNAWGEDMGHIFATDRGGPGLPFVLLVVMPLALWWMGRRLMRNGHRLPRFRWRALAAAAALLPLAVPLYMYNFKTMGVNRMVRVQPEIVTLYTEAKRDLAAGERPAQLDSLAREYQRNWFANSSDMAWRFTDPERPLIRTPVGSAPRSEEPWNIIYIQLETFRGWNTGFLRPDTSPSVTPFLDSLATLSGKASYWRRHLSMGPPTVSGFVSGLCSIKPHSFYNITNRFTYTSLECLPSVLRRHGYHAEYFTGFDPDWDGETIWVRRWFDDYTFNKKGGDRILFRRAAARIREMARGPRPWMITIASATNHIPFRSPEARFVTGPADRPNVAIGYTMRYTDDVLREFLESLRQEPWFSRTLVVITGDHGYNLGEHGPAGQLNGYRETVWVPLVIFGEHPRLPRGPRDEPASLLDIAPTLSDLVGIRDANPWMGSSLLTPGRSPSFVFQRESATLGEKDRYSMVVDPSSGRAQVFDAFTDPLQRNDISANHRAFADSLRRRAGGERLLTDYLLEANKVWPDSMHSPPSAAVLAR